MDFSNPCPQVDFPGQTWYYSSKLGNWRFRVPVFCLALRAASLYPRTSARLLQVTASLQPLTRFCLLHVIANQCLAPADTRHVSAHLARRVLATAHTSFLLHVIARHALAPADALLSSACHCEPVRTLVWQSASPQRNLASWHYFGQIRMHFPVFALGAALCFVLPQGVRIATSLRSSQ